MKNTEPLPLDVRLMNGVASALFGVVALLLLGAVLTYVQQLPFFAIRGVTVTGDVAHYNAITLRANVIPRLQGTFFTLDVNETRKVFETVPWVRQAIVRRDFPNRLKVQLQEHKAVAYWGVEGDTRLVNSFGEVFEANLGEVEQDNLPRLSGPDSQSAAVLAMYQTLQALFTPKEMALTQLELTPRGGWRVQLDAGTELELGSGSTPELLARTQRFLQTMTQATAAYKRGPDQLATVDLRHADGYAIRLNGVSTVDIDDIKKR
jgi:cell division protein FtsQ